MKNNKKFSKKSLEINNNKCKTTNVKQFIYYSCNVMNCTKCNWEHIIKYGSTAHTQRYLCHDCNSTFTIWWLKKQYSEDFIKNVMEEYCHQHKTAKEVLSEHNISSRTLIKWKNKHKEHCNKCHK